MSLEALEIETPGVNPHTNYIVGGIMRSGTSCMMQCMVDAGFPVVQNPLRQETIDKNKDADYDPNPGGLYELTRKQYQEPLFPRMHRGKFVKVLGMLGSLYPNPTGCYKVIYMRRNSNESAQSQTAFFDRPCQRPEQIDAIVEGALMHMENRRDMDFIEVWFRDFIASPRFWMTRIRHFLEVDFDVADAVRRVDPSLLRFRNEDLAPAGEIFE